MGDVLITVAPQDKNGPGHLPNLESEMVKIKKAFGIRAEAQSCISAGRLGELLKEKRIWFFAGHDAPLQGEVVLMFESEGKPEAVSIECLVSTVKPHVESGRLKLIVLAGCRTLELGRALCERAGVPDVICWQSQVESRAAKVFSVAFAEETARQVDALDPAAAFAYARSEVLLKRVDGALDNGCPAKVQMFELDVDPANADLVDQATGRLKRVEELANKGRLAAGIPVHVKGPQPIVSQAACIELLDEAQRRRTAASTPLSLDLHAISQLREHGFLSSESSGSPPPDALQQSPSASGLILHQPTAIVAGTPDTRALQARASRTPTKKSLVTLYIAGHLPDFDEKKERAIKRQLSTLAQDVMWQDVQIRRRISKGSLAPGQDIMIEAGGVVVHVHVPRDGIGVPEIYSTDSDTASSADDGQLEDEILDAKAAETRDILAAFWPEKIETAHIQAFAGSIVLVVAMPTSAAHVLLQLASQRRSELAGITLGGGERLRCCKIFGVPRLATLDDEPDMMSVCGRKVDEIESLLSQAITAGRQQAAEEPDVEILTSEDDFYSFAAAEFSPAIREILFATNYYAALGLNPAMVVDAAEVNKRFRKKSKQVHPDKCRLPREPPIMRIASAAKRQRVDPSQAAPSDSTHGSSSPALGQASGSSASPQPSEALPDARRREASPETEAAEKAANELEEAMASTADADLEAGSRKAMQRLVDARRTLTDPEECRRYFASLRATRWGESDTWVSSEGAKILEEVKHKQELVRLAQQANAAVAKAAAKDPFAELLVPPPAADSLVLHVASSDAPVLRFRIGRTTPFRGLMQSFCALRGMEEPVVSSVGDAAEARQVARFHFTFDGCTIAEADTPGSLHMEDDDQLDAALILTVFGQSDRQMHDSEPSAYSYESTQSTQVASQESAF